MKRDPLIERYARIMQTQPVDEYTYLVIAPHPGWKAGEGCPLRGWVVEMSHVVIDTRRVRPIALDGDQFEILRCDEFGCNAATHLVKL